MAKKSRKSEVTKSASQVGTISPIDLKDCRGEILKQVEENGTHFLVARRGRPLAMLVPCDSKTDLTSDALTNEQFEKLQLVADIRTEELRKLLSFYRGETTMKVLIRREKKK
ncbi:hypothetical protein ACFL6I_19145 [candidate division KSB1 bacterium]